MMVKGGERRRGRSGGQALMELLVMFLKNISFLFQTDKGSFSL